MANKSKMLERRASSATHSRIERARSLADTWSAQIEDWRESASLSARFSGTSPHQLIDMIETGRNENGDPLTSFEAEALCEAYAKTFGEMPPLKRKVKGHCSNDDPPEEADAKPEQLAHNQIMSRKDVARLLNASVSTVDRMVKRGELPMKRKISERRVGWLASEIDGFIERMDRKP